MKKGSLIKKILCALLAAVIIFCAGWAGLMFRYYPSYRKNLKESAPVSFNAAGNLQEKDGDTKVLPGEIIMMSFNIRCIAPVDLGHKSWFYRAKYVMEDVVKSSADVIGFQEVTKWQYDFLKKKMPAYDSVIDYRDGKFNSEGCPVFYRQDRFELIKKGSFWLSETPDVMSKYQGAACYRICSYAVLREKKTGLDFAVFNTHLDHKSDEARIYGIGVVMDKIKEFGSLPSVIMGDLNARENSETYKNCTANFTDVKYLTREPDSGATYHNWGKEPDNTCIDYFMTSPSGFRVNSFRVMRNTFDGDYASDHYPILFSATLE